MNIGRSTAQIEHLNTRKENEGDDTVKAFDLTVTVETDADVLSEALSFGGEIIDARGIFWNDEGVTILQRLYPLRLAEKIDDVTVTLYDQPGDALSEEEMIFIGASLAKVIATPLFEHRVRLQFKIQAHPTRLDQADRLWSLVGNDCDLAVTPSAQQEMPLAATG